MTLDKASLEKFVVLVGPHVIGNEADGPGWIIPQDGGAYPIPGWIPGPWNAMAGILGLAEKLEDRELSGKIVELVGQAIRRTVVNAIGSGMTRVA